MPLDWRYKRAETEDLRCLVAKRWKTNLLLGMSAKELGNDGERSRYNSAILIQKDGGFGGRYDKMHRVPFGEFVPLRDWLPWMNRFAPYDFDYSIQPGQNFTRFSIAPVTPPHSHYLHEPCSAGVIICYEDTDPSLARHYVQPGDEPPVDFLINISNDGWFNGSCEHEEHLAICRFRAIECRRSIARAVNMGISTVIDGNGQVLWPWKTYRMWPDGREEYDDYSLPTGDVDWEHNERGWLAPPSLLQKLKKSVPSLAGLIRDKESADAVIGRHEFADFKQVAGVFHYGVPLDTRSSLYARYGDWLPWSCWAILGMGLVWGLVRRSPILNNA